ncbi:MAG: serine--tRNA ligase [Erysipelotrichaceae bacterium]|jgi:seryl-tRNA synthetase|nr:serine--tRNA ligase [Erysipelotrichaceae bacterium]
MLDLNLIRDNPSYVKKALKKRGVSLDEKTILTLDEEKRQLIKVVETNKAEQNRLSKYVPIAKKKGEDVAALFEAVNKLSADNLVHEARLKAVDETLTAILVELPNLPDKDLVGGGKEHNKAIKTVGTKPVFTFKPQDHVALATSLGLIDYERAAKISGHGTWIYTNLGARLEWALISFFINEHLKDGYEMMMPPYLLNEASGFVAGQFPKFRDDVFWLNGIEPKKFLLPTAETALINLHREEILEATSLPRKYFAYTNCFRKEAGSYGQEERGMIRGYQFNKVELVQYTLPQDSDRAFKELVKKAESLVNKLGLHYQVSKLAAGDISHAMARTYDIEVFIPSMDIYKEVSSASNARDYQARRGKIRYRDENKKTQLVHTLNASGLATSRIFPAILEQFQQEDGSVLIPKVLWPYLKGIKVLKPIR